MLSKPLLLLILMAGACTSAIDPVVRALEIETQGAEFVLPPTERSVAVPFTVTNRGAVSAFLAACGGRIMVAINRRDEGRWVQYSGNPCTTAMSMAPVELEPGQTIPGTATIREAGEYRFRIGVRVDGQTVWKPTSPPFVVLWGSQGVAAPRNGLQFTRE